MAIITISRGSFSKGKEVAEKVAIRLGYTTVSREVILEASNDFQISQSKLDHAIHDAPSVFERFTFEKQKYVAYVAAEILAHFQRDNVVYHGLAGHFFAKNVAHLLKVRIMADMEDRIASLMQRKKMSREQAESFLSRDDQERRDWSLQLYGVDTTDISLYDLAINISKLTVDNAVELICQAAVLPQFRTTPESRKAIEELALAARIKASLMNEYPTCDVTVHGQEIEISAQVSAYSNTEIGEDIREKAMQVPGVSSVTVKLTPRSLFR